jgi:Na+/pantothenate symporter
LAIVEVADTFAVVGTEALVGVVLLVTGCALPVSVISELGAVEQPANEINPGNRSDRYPGHAFIMSTLLNRGKKLRNEDQ